MSKKSQETPKAKQIRSLRLAFKFAKEGKSDLAVKLWDEAIAFGYEPSEKTLNNLRIEIKKGLKADVGLGSTLPSGSDARDTERHS